METREILKKVRRIEIVTNRLVNEVMAGEYHSVFKGRGIEFEEVREYQPGDDIRTIDWNVTARTGHPFVKRYKEERELTVVFVVDVSSSSQFGSKTRLKSELQTEIAALLAFSAIRNNDRVGLLMFSNSVEKYIPPKKGKKHVLRVIKEILAFQPEGQGTDIKEALGYLNRVLKRKAVVFLISDFMDENFDKALSIVNKRHDLIAISTKDPRENELPSAGILELQDAETGEIILIDTFDWEIRRQFKENAEKADVVLKKQFRQLKIDHIEVRTDRSYDDTLVSFFHKRARRW